MVPAMLPIEVAIDLLADATWELGLKPLYQASKTHFFGPKVQRPELAEAIEGSAEQLAGPAHSSPELWSSFLASAEVRTLVLDLFTFKLADTSTTPVLDALSQAWIRHVGATKAPDIQDTLAQLDQSIQYLIDVGAEIGVLAVGADRECMDARRRVVSARLLEIPKLDRTTPDARVARDYELFAAELRTEVAMRYGKIEPPNLLAREAVPIERLFVTPLIDAESGDTTLTSFVDSIDRRVILGNPGAGKSTLASMICHTLALSYADPEINPRSLTPWCIDLRRLPALHATNAAPLSNFFTKWAETSYQLSVPDGAFEWLLSRGRLLVIFDGLDELLDISTRQDVRDSVESFCRRFTAVPVLVTSRVVGYRQAPLDHNVFETMALQDFDEQRIARYSSMWFDIRSRDEPTPARREHANQFLTDSTPARELRSNPLMLGLLASLYRGPGSIPRNLPDVYDSCATLLFSTWDKLKGVEVVLPFAEHIRPALRELAWWWFTTPKLEEGITRPQAVERTATYLQRRRFGSPERARSAAEDFVDFCRGRAWVFTDQGSTSTNEDLFGFTHRTFLEFFSAEYLAYRKQSAEELVQELVPFIAKEERDVVIRIALQIKARMYPDGADDIITALISAFQALPASEVAAGIGFLLRLLQGVIPSPETARRVGSQIMVYSPGAFDSLAPAIAAVGEEIRVELARGLVVGQRELLRRHSERRRDFTVDLIFRPERLVEGPAVPFWQAVGRGTQTAYPEEIRAAAKLHLTVALAAWPSIISIDELVKYHGVQAALCPVNDPGEPPVWKLLAKARAGESSSWLELERFGRILAEIDVPWVSDVRAGLLSLYEDELVALACAPQTLARTEAQRVAISLLFVCVTEALMRLNAQVDRDRLARLLAATRGSSNPFFRSLDRVLQAATSTGHLSSSAVSDLDLPAAVAALLELWGRGQIQVLSQ
jgi:hypothetical protein